jgi:uncharacterized NAD-dependent epimerase/dehydratase family protein
MKELFDLSNAVYLILAEGSVGVHSAKTAMAAIRYFPERVGAVIDSTHAGKRVADVLGFGGPIPIVASLDEAFTRAGSTPTALLVGVAPRGGRLPAAWTEIIASAAQRGLDIVSGLHEFLYDNAAIRAAAGSSGARIHDLRRPPAGLSISTGLARKVACFTVLTVGTDCNVGKMTTMLEIRRHLADAGERVAFAATGQTGILVEGWGIAVDAVVADYIAGAAEQLVLRGEQIVGPGGIVLVEGQGALIHPAYSGVTLGLLHGALPHALILCHDVERVSIRSGGEYDFVRMPPLRETMQLVEAAAGWVRPAPIIGIALKTAGLSEADARREIERTHAETGLPVADTVRFGAGPLVEVVQRHANEFRHRRAGAGVAAR